MVSCPTAATNINFMAVATLLSAGVTAVIIAGLGATVAVDAIAVTGEVPLALTTPYCPP